VERHWEIIADNLSKAGWSLGCVSAIDSNGRTLWIVDAHRDDGKRFVVRADEKLTSFRELEAAIALAKNFLDNLARFFSDSKFSTDSESGGGLSPAGFFVSSGPATTETTSGGKERKN
jgi:hypothetical protein